MVGPDRLAVEQLVEVREAALLILRRNSTPWDKLNGLFWWCNLCTWAMEQAAGYALRLDCQHATLGFESVAQFQNSSPARWATPLRRKTQTVKKLHVQTFDCWSTFMKIVNVLIIVADGIVVARMKESEDYKSLGESWIRHLLWGQTCPTLLCESINYGSVVVPHSLRIWQCALPEWHERSCPSRQQGLPPLAKVCLALRRFPRLSSYIRCIWWETQPPSSRAEQWLNWLLPGILSKVLDFSCFILISFTSLVENIRFPAYPKAPNVYKQHGLQLKDYFVLTFLLPRPYYTRTRN